MLLKQFSISVQLKSVFEGGEQDLFEKKMKPRSGDNNGSSSIHDRSEHPSSPELKASVENGRRRVRKNTKFPMRNTAFIYIKNSAPYMFNRIKLTGPRHKTTHWNVIFSTTISK